MNRVAEAAYLIWLGIKLWRAEPTLDVVGAPARENGNRTMFWNAYVVTALNPKSIVFFTAFVPQFIAIDRPLLPQFAILEATFLILATIGAAVWAILAGELRARFRRPSTLRLVNRIGGGFLIGAGVLTAIARRA